MYVLTRHINEYDQFGDYFEAIFKDIPSKEELAEVLGLRVYDDLYYEHLISGGGRIKQEYEWYFLTKIKFGEKYKK